MKPKQNKTKIKFFSLCFVNEWILNKAKENKEKHKEEKYDDVGKADKKDEKCRKQEKNTHRIHHNDLQPNKPNSHICK